MSRQTALRGMWISIRSRRHLLKYNKILALIYFLSTAGTRDILGDNFDENTSKTMATRPDHWTGDDAQPIKLIDDFSRFNAVAIRFCPYLRRCVVAHFHFLSRQCSGTADYGKVERHVRLKAIVYGWFGACSRFLCPRSVFAKFHVSSRLPGITSNRQLNAF